MSVAERVVERLEVHEERMAFLFDMIVELRDKQTDPELRQSLNSMKYVLSGRPDCVPAAVALIRSLQQEVARKDEAIDEIETWAKAYPLNVFPEPDFAKARRALEREGINLDSVSASNMRHVLSGVLEIIRHARDAMAEKT